MLVSFLDIPADSHFSLHNLPFGIFSPVPGVAPRVATALGDWVIDLAALQDAGLLTGKALAAQPDVFAHPTLNAFMALGPDAWRETRAALQDLFRADNSRLRDDPELRRQVLFPRSGVEMHLPAEIGDYTDFYSSREHASNVGAMFRDPENPLLPNWLHLPVAYHGRASSVVLSGVDIHRPVGQIVPAGTNAPEVAPSREVDFELELGFFIGPGNTLGHPVTVDEAGDHIFGFILVNDWSARDIQRWEYRPLGPFLAKNFATSISPWIVTLDALAPFRVPGPPQDPEPLPYLQTTGDWAFNIHLEARLQTPGLPEPYTITNTNARTLYWNVCQQLAHHTLTGCNLRPGDLLASGTISGPTPDSYGSLLELSWRGTKPLQLPNGETRTFLEDGDRVTFTGYCQGDSYRVGFGKVTARLLPAVRSSKG